MKNSLPAWSSDSSGGVEPQNNKPIKINFGQVKRNSFKENKGGVVGRRLKKRGYLSTYISLCIYISIYDSHCCMAETNTSL